MSRTNAKDYDVMIVGAGLIGAALALLLAKKTDLKVAVVERAAPLKQAKYNNQRVVALGHAAKQVLTQVGVFEQLSAEHCYSYQRMFVWDENSHGELEFNTDDLNELITESETGVTDSLGYMIDSHYCNYVLQQALLEQGDVDCFFSATPINLALDSNSPNATLQLANESQGEQFLSATLTVAADGGNSWVRQQARIFANRQSYKQQGIVANVKSSLAHQDTAWQRFLNTGPVAVLPLSDNHSSIVWSAEQTFAQSLMSLDDAEFCKSLSQALEGRLGEFELCSKRLSFDLQSQRAETYFSNHVVLIGDAAHSIHPLAGQGANLGFKDIACLADLLQNTSAKDCASPILLQRYERVRKADNEQTDIMMSALNKAYQGQAGLWLAIRGAGMNWLNHSGTIKRLLAKQAMGL